MHFLLNLSVRITFKNPIQCIQHEDILTNLYLFCDVWELFMLRKILGYKAGDKLGITLDYDCKSRTRIH